MGATLRGRDALKRDDSSEIRYLRIADLSDDGLLDPSRAEPVKIEPSDFQKFGLRRGDIVIANRGARTTAGLFRGDEKAVAGGQFFILTLKRQGVLPEYLWWFLNLPGTQQHFRSGLRGTYVKGLTRSSFENLSVPIPSIEEQKHIAGVFALRLRENRLRRKLESLKDIFYSSLLSRHVRQF